MFSSLRLFTIRIHAKSMRQFSFIITSDDSLRFSNSQVGDCVRLFRCGDMNSMKPISLNSNVELMQTYRVDNENTSKLLYNWHFIFNILSIVNWFYRCKHKDKQSAYILGMSKAGGAFFFSLARCHTRRAYSTYIRRNRSQYEDLSLAKFSE